MVRGARPFGAPPGFVDDVAQDPVEPGVEATALPCEAPDGVEGAGHRLADRVLGGEIVGQAPPGEGEQPPVGAPVELLPGVRVLPGGASHEQPQVMVAHLLQHDRPKPDRNISGELRQQTATGLGQLIRHDLRRRSA